MYTKFLLSYHFKLMETAWHEWKQYGQIRAYEWLKDTWYTLMAFQAQACWYPAPSQNEIFGK